MANDKEKKATMKTTIEEWLNYQLQSKKSKEATRGKADIETMIRKAKKELADGAVDQIILFLDMVVERLDTADSNKKRWIMELLNESFITKGMKRHINSMPALYPLIKKINKAYGQSVCAIFSLDAETLLYGQTKTDETGLTTSAIGMGSQWVAAVSRELVREDRMAAGALLFQLQNFDPEKTRSDKSEIEEYEAAIQSLSTEPELMAAMQEYALEKEKHSGNIQAGDVEARTSADQETERREWETKKKEYEERISILEDRNDELHSKVEDLINEINTKKTEHSKAIKVKDHYKELAKRNELESGAFADLREHYQEKRQEYEEKLKKIKTQANGLSDSLKEAEADIERKASDLITKQDEIGKLKQDISKITESASAETLRRFMSILSSKINNFCRYYDDWKKGTENVYDSIDMFGADVKELLVHLENKLGLLRIGEFDAILPYDTALHKSGAMIASGENVRVIVPGWRTEETVLEKAQVEQEGETR